MNNIIIILIKLYQVQVEPFDDKLIGLTQKPIYYVLENDDNPMDDSASSKPYPKLDVDIDNGEIQVDFLEDKQDCEKANLNCEQIENLLLNVQDPDETERSTEVGYYNHYSLNIIY